MDEFRLLIDLHKNHQRQGPGGDEETGKAFHLAGVDRNRSLKIADIGCGTGASTLTLARLLDAEIVAVDFLREFLDVLDERARRDRVSDRITTLCCEMDSLPFEPETFDIIWSEGAIYNIGFQKGIIDWRPFLKSGGLLVVSEISWLTDERPAELQAYWDREYPEIDTPSSKIRQLEASGYSPVAYFALPERCWITNYYEPIRSGFEDFLARNSNSEGARAIVDAEQQEMALYSKYKAYFSYGVYIARRFDEQDA